MTVSEIARQLDVPVCTGGCGLSVSRHSRGTIDPFGVIHFAERRFTRRGARNLLLLIARRDREADAGYLNVPVFDWWYVYHDSVTAARMARSLGFVIPARLWDLDREWCRLLAARRGVRLGKYRRVYNWVRS